MTKTQEIANKVRDALRAERDTLRGKNDAAANAITDFLFEARDESYVRLYEILTAKELA